MSSSDDEPARDVAVVAIGRNEGDRLTSCLRSAMQQALFVVYVDSGSTDRSVEMAEAKGALVVRLEMGQPFTAARARNAGFERAMLAHEGIRYVQFVDGDCEFELGWLAVARAYLEQNPGVSAVFGRRRERFPDRSIYNRLCDIEWDVAAGEVKYCGGDVLIRAAALRDVGGYRESLIAGEEPELCIRLRRLGGKIACLDQPMTIHDAAMSRFGQWWRRMRRSGHAFAEGAMLHGSAPEHHWVTETCRTWLWGVLAPCGVLAAAVLISADCLLLAAIYPLQFARLYAIRRNLTRWPILTSAAAVLCKFPEAAGMLTYHYNRLRSRSSALIEYK